MKIVANTLFFFLLPMMLCVIYANIYTPNANYGASGNINPIMFAVCIVLGLISCLIYLHIAISEKDGPMY
jgi:hypothetical protein